jgi:hypothetical protein
VEDIDAVLGRFEAWAGTRNAVEAKAGIRELSYEEALRSSRYRWQGADDKPDAKKKPGVVPVAGGDSGPKAGRTKADSTQAGGAKRRAVKVRARSHAAKAGPDARSAKSVSAANITVNPVFREVLAEAVRPAEVVVASARPMELARQVAISIRLAPAERALIKTRAAEAGISASAYVRQCALEVEQLRAQVREAIAAMEGSPSAPMRESVSAPGFFGRLARRFFPRSAPALALRA